MGVAAVRHVMLDTEEDKKKPTTLLELRDSSPCCPLSRLKVSQGLSHPRNPLWMFLAAYASLGLRLTKFDFNAGPLL